MPAWTQSAAFLNGIMANARLTFSEAFARNAPDVRVPEYLTQWLGRLRLLYGVPFTNLVSHSMLLPKESIRFFYVDRNWTDRLVDGALSVGKTSTREYVHHHAVQDVVTSAADDEERAVRDRLRERTVSPPASAGGELTGLLMRSAVVSGWPGLSVKAYRNGTQLTLLRMDRPSPDILLCIFSEVPTRVDIEEPEQGIQFGAEVEYPDAQGLPQPTQQRPSGHYMYLRNMTGAHAGERVTPLVAHAIPVRRDARDVIHVQQLQAELEAEVNAQFHTPNNKLSPAEFAVQMLQPPFRQRFENAVLVSPKGGRRKQWPPKLSVAASEIVGSPLTDPERLLLISPVPPRQ